MGRRKLLDSTYYVMKRMGRAVYDEKMFPANGTVLVGVSGGCGSAALLFALVERQKRVPVPVRFVAGYVPDGVNGLADEIASTIAGFCRELGVELLLVPGCSPQEHRWPEVPHQEELFSLARQAQASTIALGHTIQDRALAVLASMIVGHRHTDGHGPADPGASRVQTPGEARVQVVRPFQYLTEEAIRLMAVEEKIPFSPPRIFPPDYELRQIILDHLRSKRGTLIEKLRNITCAPGRVNEEYLV